MGKSHGLETGIALGFLASSLYFARRMRGPRHADDPLGVLKSSSAKYPLPKGFVPSYGTAGFRANGSLLGSTVFRSGIIAAARALKTGKVTGICITASHNPEEDNGVKISEPGGEMLLMDWEPHANHLATQATDAELALAVAELLESEGISLNGAKGTVYLAMDTRPTGPKLLAAARLGVEALGCTAVDLGVLTTPQLHFAVRSANAGEPGRDEGFYFSTLAGGFKTLVEGKPANSPARLVVDCANGVGAMKLARLAKAVKSVGFAADMRNTECGVPGKLNGGCGADYVQKEQKLPGGMGPADAGCRGVSLDGDADRLVYFGVRPSGGMQLLDGDKVAALAALFVKEQMSHLPASIVHRPPGARVGVVQTAYANGASTRYIREKLGIATKTTPTGVKYLHEEAHKFDVGIYFEANGHGTVLFSDGFLSNLRGCAATSPSAVALLAMSKVINQAVGDALSGVLMVEGILRHKDWGLEEWSALYTDLPSRQLKVKVEDRSVIVTTDAETRAASPQGLQALVDKSVAKVDMGRSFVRPSGTEDVVRVYAEASTQEAADALAAEVARHVHATCGGVGPAP